MVLLEKWTPLRELDMLDRRMRRLLGDFGYPALTPAADVYEAERELILELEVPGFDEKDLTIELSNHTLSILGERAEVSEHEDEALRLHERLEKTFQRRFTLPPDFDPEHVRAEYAKGVLTVHVPKSLEMEPRKVEIATGQ